MLEFKKISCVDFELKELNWAQAFMKKLRGLERKLLRQKQEPKSYKSDGNTVAVNMTHKTAVEQLSSEM